MDRSKHTSPTGLKLMFASASAAKAVTASANGRMQSRLHMFSVKNVKFIIIAARQTIVFSAM
jgi:hypothetical protein